MLTDTMGAGESSKTTFLKQMQFLYSEEISQDERYMWRNIIYSNLTSVFQYFFRVREGHRRNTGSFQEIWAENLDKEVDAGLGDGLPSDFAMLLRWVLPYGSILEGALNHGMVDYIPAQLD